MTRVALVVMPFAAEDGPALGASLLRAALVRDGVACDLHYLNLNFASSVGLDRYRAIDRLAPLLPGEWIFAPSVFGEALPPAEEYIREVLSSDPSAAEGLAELRDAARAFIDDRVRSIDWTLYNVIGFSSSFQQNLASLALARRIRAIHPAAKIAMGGANCESDMGVALLESFPELDAVASGESDETFPRLVAEWAAGRDGSGIPGISVRTASGVRSDPAPHPVERLDDLPIPDFHDYYAALEASGLALRPAATHLRFETGRGCWWGERAHCTFCGLNGGTMAFRRKSTERVIAELDALAEYPTRSLLAADNILDERAHDDLLPALARRGGRQRLFYEIKASVTREQVALMAAAGIWRLQPGIESLSTSVLGRMRKGTRGVENIALLKWASDHDIALTWNWLCGFPGEEPAEHERMAAFLPKLHHLQPPTGLFEVQVHRFAPFHSDPESRGIGPIRPSRAYRHVYALPEETLARIAYYFDRVRPASLPPATDRLAQAVAAWRTSAGRGAESLVALDAGETLFVRDTRSCATAPEHLITGFALQIMRACDAPARAEEIARRLNASEETVTRAASALEEKGLVVALDGRFVALPLRVESDEGASEHLADVATEISRARARDLFHRGSGGM